MAERIDLGIVGIKNMGEYDSQTQYEKLNVVTYQGSTYCALKDAKNIVPTNTTYWQLYAQKGDTGATGATGGTGPQGPQGIQGEPGGTPIVVSSTADMIDTTKVYVNTTDGKWYYYDGDSWEIGGTYQSTGIAESSVFLPMLENKLQNNFKGSMTIVTGITWNSGGYYKDNGTIRTDEHYAYSDKISVNPNEIYFYPNSSGVNNTVVLFYDDTAIGTIESADYLNTFIIPSNVNKIGLTSLIRTDRPKRPNTLYKMNNYYINGQSKIMYGDMDKAFQNSFVPYYTDITSDLDFVNGYWHVTALNQLTDGYAETSNFNATQINVIPGEKYKITGAYTANVALYQLIGGSNTVSYPSANSGSSTTFESKEITIPDGVYLLNISGYKNSVSHGAIKVEKINGYTFTGIDNSKSYEIKQLQNFNIEEQLKNDFKWSNSITSGKYATFTFDDLRTDIDQIEDLFESKNVPCCFAAIPSRLETTTSTSHETMKEVLDRAIENGGEVLAHWGSPLTSSSTDTDYYNVYVGAKKTLEEAGYEVNGIITAGGTNYQTQDFTKDTILARNNYFYADLTATNNINIEQYWNRRNFLDSGVANIKSLIDNYVAGTGTQPHSKWLNFASHGTADTSLSDIEEIIDYCLANNIQIVTWKYLYDHFKSSKLEERIKNLEH